MTLTDAHAKLAPPSRQRRRRGARRRSARFCRDFAESRIAVAALVVLVLIVLVALLAPLIAPQNPYDLAAARHARQPPAARISGMPPATLTGWAPMARAATCCSAILYGLRISLVVGVTSGLIALRDRHGWSV